MFRIVSAVRTPVEVVRQVPVPAAVAVAVIEAAPERVVGSGIGLATSDETLARIGPELAGAAPVTREVHVGIGRIIDDEGIVVLPLWWEDAEHPELFPTFDGGLELRDDGQGTELHLLGSYQPPLGALGRFGDALAGHRIVVASLERFLREIAARLTAAAGSVQGS